MTACLLGREGGPVDGLIVDLDDTVYPQRAFLAGACDAVAARAAEDGVDASALREALERALEGGSDRGGTIDRALAAVGADVPVAPLVTAFLSYRPERLDPYPGVPRALARLSRLVPLVLVSDGDPASQRAKLSATGVGEWFSAVVLCDELGREHRKPDPLGFRRALAALDLPPEAVVAIGDRPDKDVEGAHRAGVRALRVHTGEYAGLPEHPETWAVSDTLVEALAFVEKRLAVPARASRPRSSPRGIGSGGRPVLP